MVVTVPEKQEKKPLTFMIGADAPVVATRTRETFTAAEVSMANAIIEAWRKAGPSADFATAVSGKLHVGDGIAYANKVAARKAAGHVVSLMRKVLMFDKSGTLHVVTGGHLSGTGVSWALYLGPYEEPKKRAPKTPKETATAAPAEAVTAAPAEAAK